MEPRWPARRRQTAGGRSATGGLPPGHYGDRRVEGKESSSRDEGRTGEEPRPRRQPRNRPRQRERRARKRTAATARAAIPGAPPRRSTRRGRHARRSRRELQRPRPGQAISFCASGSPGSRRRPTGARLRSSPSPTARGSSASEVRRGRSPPGCLRLEGEAFVRASPPSPAKERPRKPKRTAGRERSYPTEEGTIETPRGTERRPIRKAPELRTSRGGRNRR